MTGGVPYLGSKISLISRSEIRYEGILYTIDTKESTLALAKVRAFGTEDRPTDRPVAPRDEVYEYIIFRASDIKDLHVCEPPRNPLLATGLASDPAIVHHSPPIPSFLSSLAGYPHHYPPVPYNMPRPQTQVTPPPPRKPTAPETNDASVQVDGITMNAGGGVRRGSASQRPRSSMYNCRPGQSQGNRPPQVRRNGPPNPRPPIRNAPYSWPTLQTPIPPPTRNPRFGGNRGRNRFRFNVGNRTPGLQTPSVLKFDNSFDFEEANAKFQEMENKENEAEEELNKNDQELKMEENTYYDKSKSFFDKISCYSIDGINSMDRRKEIQLNQETFGVIYTWKRRGRGGFRGRGGLRQRATPFSKPLGESPSFQLPTHEWEGHQPIDTPLKSQKEPPGNVEPVDGDAKVATLDAKVPSMDVKIPTLDVKIPTLDAKVPTLDVKGTDPIIEVGGNWPTGQKAEQWL